MINSQICTENISNTFINLPEAEAGYIIEGWADINGVQYNEGENFVNLVNEDGAIINLFAYSSPIEYKVNYFINNELVESIECVYDKTYKHRGLFAMNNLEKMEKVDGWYNENEERFVPNTDFTNLTTINDYEINLYGTKEIITLPEKSVEPEPETIRYTVCYYFDGEFIGLQDVPENMVSNFFDLPEAESGYVVDGWTTVNGERYKAGDEFVNLSNENDAIINLYAVSIAIEEPTTEEPTIEEPTTEEPTTEEPTTEEPTSPKPVIEVLGTNDELPSPPDVPTYIPDTGDNNSVIVSSITLVVSMIAIVWVFLSSKSKKETV